MAKTRYLLLDEPVSALDLRQQRAVFAALRRLTNDGIGIVTAIHDLQLAAIHADRIVLMRGGRILAAGPRDDVLTPSLIETWFDVPVEIVQGTAGRFVLPAESGTFDAFARRVEFFGIRH